MMSSLTLNLLLSVPENSYELQFQHFFFAFCYLNNRGPHVAMKCVSDYFWAYGDSAYEVALIHYQVM